MGSLGTPGSSQDSGVGVRGWEEAAWTGWPRHAVKVFRNLLTLQTRGV